MKILVTGANGFVGRYVLRELAATPHHIIATSVEPTLQLLENVDPGKITYIPCNLNDSRKNFFDFFQQPEMLIHLAWEGLPNYRELFHLERNVLANYGFLKNMLEHGLRSVVVAGTCLEYGMQDGLLHEQLDPRPTIPYALAKDTLRKFLEQLQKTLQFDLKWVRLFYLYGQGQSPKSLLSQLDRALEHGDAVFKMSGGEQLRDYLPVERVAAKIVGIAGQFRVDGIINCCSGVPISIRRLVENHLQQSHRQIELNLGYYPYPDYEPMAFWGDPSKMRRALGDVE